MGDIDVDAGTVLSRNRTLAEVGSEIYDALLEAANGAPTAASGTATGSSPSAVSTPFVASGISLREITDLLTRIPSAHTP